MRLRLLTVAGLVAAGAVASARQAPPLVTPVGGMVIDHSVRIRPGTYRLASADVDTPAITVRGEHVVVDFTGVTIEGGDPIAEPDGYSGTGILVEGGADVTIRHAAVRGYKVAVLGRHSPRLHLVDNDFSYNWKARLWSGIEKESLVDWLTHHDNEHDQWLRYGAAVYLADCDEAEVSGNTAVQGQNGLMVTRSARLTVTDNTFSWMSGLGIGLYRTTDSTIARNRLDWDVRGYSHGFYNRGQDSAALLMYEQSSRNLVADNSATHGGDGLFLWAGQSTMDTGQGGANDNVFVGNDFSHAVANGIEATFSRNRFFGNRIDDCWHGVWGGYSFDTYFIDNSFSKNTDGIAIEHGQHIVIADNRFDGDETAIRVWANASQDPNWGYPKTRDTRSHDYTIDGNTFSGNKTALNLLRTSDVNVSGNRYDRVGVPLQTGADVRALAFEPASPPTRSDLPAAPPGPRSTAARLPAGARRGRDAIIVDEWGPYDYRSPKAWPAGRPGDRPLKLRVLGPPGQWMLASITGGRLTARSGDVPGDVAVQIDGDGTDLAITLDYVGAEVVTPRGVHYAAGARVPFGYTQFDPAVDWRVSFWTYSETADPVTAPDAFAAVLRGKPIKTVEARHLDYLSGGALAPDLPPDRVALRADGDVQLPAGSTDMTVISDDGVRVWVDGRLALDRWSVHESVVDHIALDGGRHRLRIEYLEATGWAELQVRFGK